MLAALDANEQRAQDTSNRAVGMLFFNFLNSHLIILLLIFFLGTYRVGFFFPFSFLFVILSCVVYN
jgi:hypothetical protein